MVHKACVAFSAEFRWFDASEIRAESGKNSFWARFVFCFSIFIISFVVVPRILWQFTNSSLFSPFTVLAVRSKSNSNGGIYRDVISNWEISSWTDKFRLFNYVIHNFLVFITGVRARALLHFHFSMLSFCCANDEPAEDHFRSDDIDERVALQMTTFNLLIQMKRLRLTFFLLFPPLDLYPDNHERKTKGPLWIVECDERIRRLVVDWLNKRECLICRWSRTTK